MTKTNQIATRTYQTASGKEVVVTLYAATNEHAPHAWTCQFTIEGLSQNASGQGVGMDALQALTVAIQGIRFHLEAAQEDFQWEGGEMGDFGIPLAIPEGFGSRIEERLRSMLNEEVARLLRQGRP